MKRIASLFLLVSLFYNALGYYVMFVQKEEQTWVASMEKKDNSKFKVIHLNASLYSFIEDTDFQYINENVSINNRTYHVFKKRIQNNVLSLYYLPNLHQEVISKSLNDIVDNQLFNNSSSKDSPLKKLIKYSLQDYVVQETNSVCFSSKKIYKIIAFNTITKEAIHAGYHSLSYSPPDFV
jgi:hypothetical protein